MKEKNMNNIILHVGLTKTGTSSLQKFLAMNESVLNQMGYSYPNSRGNFCNSDIDECGRYSNDGFPCYYNFIAKRNTEWEYGWKLFEDSVQDTLMNYNVILSFEGVFFEGTEYVRYLKNKFNNIIIVVYLRRQDFWLESHRREEIKSPHLARREKNSAMTMEEFIKCQMTKGAYAPDWGGENIYLDAIDGFESIVGRDNISVYLYEEAIKEGIERHFLKNQLGIDLDSLPFTPVSKVNESTGVYETEIHRKYNENVLFNSNRRNDDVLVSEFISSIGKMGLESENGYYLSQMDRKRILNFFEDGNCEIAKRYFGKNELFDYCIDYPVIEIDQETLKDKYIELLENIVINLANQRDYPVQLALAINKGKRLAFWGAGKCALDEIKTGRFLPEVIIDNDQKKDKAIIEGIEIVWSGRLTNIKEYVFIITPYFSEEIEEQLDGLGLKSGIDYFLLKDIYTL